MAKKQSTKGMATTNAQVRSNARALASRAPKKMSKRSLGQSYSH